MTACEKCWTDAAKRTFHNGRSQYDNYKDLLREYGSDDHAAIRPVLSGGEPRASRDIGPRVTCFCGAEHITGWCLSVRARATEPPVEGGR